MKGEKTFRRAMDHLLEGCQIIDRDYRYVYVNAAAAEQGKTTPEALIGKTMFEAYPNIETTVLFQEIQSVMEGRKPRKAENVFTFNDGDSGWFELSIQPVPEGVLVLSIQLTERKKHLAEREALMREKDVLFQELQHRVKNSLNMINAILYLKESEAENDTIREALRSVHGRIEVLTLLYRLVDANSSSGVRLDEYLRTVCSSMSYAHDAEARGILIAADFAPCSIDLKRGANIGLVLNELLGNALNYAFPAERLAQRGGTVELALRQTAEELVLEVSDDGVGLPEGCRIEESGGFGFRLAMELMEQSAGTLEHLAESKGAAFRVRLRL